MPSSMSPRTCSSTTSRKFWSPRGTSRTLREAAKATLVRMIMLSHVYVTWSGMPGRWKIGGCSMASMLSARAAKSEPPRDHVARQDAEPGHQRDGVRPSGREEPRAGGHTGGKPQSRADQPRDRPGAARGGRRRGTRRKPPEVHNGERAACERADGHGGAAEEGTERSERRDRRGSIERHPRRQLTRSHRAPAPHA